MEKLKFNTVGQFLVALEEGSLYGIDDKKYTLSDKSCKVIVVDMTARHSFSVDTLEGVRDRIYENKFTRSRSIPDKALVWCWNDGWEVRRDIRFYNAKDGCVFHVYGHRDGSNYSNYEVIEPNEQGLYEHPFEWANEAKKKLED